MNIVDISEKRYTAKHYDKNKHVSKAQLDSLLQVLRNAPSSVNSQPWHFIVVNNQTAQAKILPAVAEFNYARIMDSSYTIIFCIKTDLTDDYLTHLIEKEAQDGRFPNEAIKQAQDQSRRYFVNYNSSTKSSLLEWESKQVYIALGQLLWAATMIGIDSTPIEGFNTEKMDELLDLKAQGLKSVVLASLGFHAENDGNATRPKSRLPAEELFTFI